MGILFIFFNLNIEQFFILSNKIFIKGIPSISIFAHELITVFGVKKLIRIGTCGAVSKEVKVRGNFL